MGPLLIQTQLRDPTLDVGTIELLGLHADDACRILELASRGAQFRPFELRDQEVLSAVAKSMTLNWPRRANASSAAS